MRPKYLDIPVEALTRHICILGTTGSGKSTTAAVLAFELRNAGISTLLLDRTGEYPAMLGKLPGARVYRPGENLTMAPLQRDKDLSVPLQVEGWVSLLGHYTTVSYGSPISALQGRVLREVLLGYYRGTDSTLTISHLISNLEEYERRVRQRGGWEESIEALISRLYPLTVDLVGKTLDRPFTDFELGSLFDGSLSVIDLSPLGEDNAKNLLSQLILKLVFTKVKEMGRTRSPRLAVIVDEAQHLSPDRDYLSIPERCAIELRKYGFSLVMIATRPSMISQNVLANCGTVISHLLTNERDLRATAGCFIGGADHSNIDKLRRLGTGRALAQVNYPLPDYPASYSIGLAEQKAALGMFGTVDGSGVEVSPEPPLAARQQGSPR